MDLVDELNNYKNQAFDTWFDRWFKKEDLPKYFKRAAQQGYSGCQIKLKKTIPMSEEAEYLNRRLRDPRTVEKLKNEFPGIKVEFVTEKKTGLFGMTSTTEKLEFSW